MSSKVDISIVIPCFNAESTISKTINSLIVQTYIYFECIIVDDHSTDETISTVKNLINNDSRFSLVLRQSKRKGASVCRNQGLKASSGAFVMFLDADDYISPYCIQNRIKAMKENLSLDFGIFNTAIVGEKTFLFTRYSKNPLRDFLIGSYPWQTMSPLWTRAFLLKINGFNDEFPRLQDVEMHTRALMYKSVNYKYFPFLKVDSFYNFDSSKKKSAKTMERQVMGYVLYLENVLLCLKDKKHKVFLKRTYYLLIDLLGEVDIEVDIRPRLDLIENKLKLSAVDKIRIKIYKKLNKTKFINSTLAFEILFFNYYRALNYFKKIFGNNSNKLIWRD